ncbi:MAG: 4-hydroxy-tetrahydrodipicolinate synthase [Deltaproteobacteria bacterium]|nr:4-hydroxy-tetrahydrodipicolinate synthase [Deltaproteobacteria bacterium]
MDHPFQGSLVALITPFKKGKVDEEALKKLVEWHIAEGTDGIVPCGTTGESATLDYEEHDRVIEIVVKQVKGRVRVLAGTGSNATAEAIQITRHAERVGADGALLVSPYYNKPTQEGLYRHYKAIAESVGLPLILYNVPGRTSVNILPETVVRLAGIKNIVGIKEACGNLTQIKKVIELCGRDFTVLSGEDAQNFEIIALGGRGMISVTANVVPQRLARMWDRYASGKKEEARGIHEALLPLHEAMFFETNPIPVKTAVALMGRCEEEWRLPLCEMGKQNREKLLHVLKEYQLI